MKEDPDWIREFRQKALKTFSKQADADALGDARIWKHQFRQHPLLSLAAAQKPKRTWDDVPDDVKRTFERLGIPEQERKFLAGVEAQFD